MILSKSDLKVIFSFLKISKASLIAFTILVCSPFWTGISEKFEKAEAIELIVSIC